MDIEHDLPEGVLEWAAGVAGGEVVRLDRAVARREAWRIDVRAADGSLVEGFLRLDRTDGPLASTPLMKEAGIVEALGPTKVPVPDVLGRSDEVRAVLYERVPGRSDLDKLGDVDQQHAVMADFMRAIGEVHQLDLDELGLEGQLGPRPTSARASALDPVDAVVDHCAAFLAGYTDPLITFGLDWLRDNAPEEVARVSLVQGDTGPVNFMFVDDHVSAIIDWEWGHFGDPMEDLGNICVREFWNPSGGLEGMFDHYAAVSGIPYSRFSAQYYRVHQQMRGMVGIHAITTIGPPPGESLCWQLVYRYAGDRATCEAIADAMGVELERPAMPAGEGADDALARAVLHGLRADIGPEVSTSYGRSALTDAGLLVQCMDRRRRFRAELDAIELGELRSLLGTRPASAADGLGELDEALRGRKVDQADALRYLARRAYREEWLHAPAIDALYPGRVWSALD